jgi:hypothetical protein
LPLSTHHPRTIIGERLGVDPPPVDENDGSSFPTTVHRIASTPSVQPCTLPPIACVPTLIDEALMFDRNRAASLRGAAPLALSLVLLGGCGGTGRFVEQPRLTVDKPEDARQAVGELFGLLTPPYSVQLCEADISSRKCTEAHRGISAKGVGGLLLPILPLTLYVQGMDVRQQHPSADGFVFNAALHATVDAISPACGIVEGTIVSRGNNTASLQLRNFYCNWVVVGNVLVNADLSIDSIDLKGRVVTGFYKITFHGTGNATGSGYYRAVITTKTG